MANLSFFGHKDRHRASITIIVWRGNWVCYEAIVDSLHKRTAWARGWGRRGNKGISAISGCQSSSTMISYILLLLEDGGWGEGGPVLGSQSTDTFDGKLDGIVVPIKHCGVVVLQFLMSAKRYLIPNRELLVAEQAIFRPPKLTHL